MLRPTIRHRTVQPQDSGRLAPPTKPTESHGGLLSIPTHNHNYTIFPISLTGSMTLNDLERRNSPYFALFHRIR